MSTFQDLNIEIAEAQKALEAAIAAEKDAIDKADHAKIALSMADSTLKKTRLDKKVFDTRLNSAMERSRNLRKEASI